MTRRKPALTERQTAVLTQLAAGCTEEQAARVLGISPRTLRRDVAAAEHVLGAATMCQAVALAVSRRLVDPAPRRAAA